MKAVSFVVISTLILLMASTSITILPSALADTSTIKLFGTYHSIYQTNATAIPFFRGDPYFEANTYFENKTGDLIWDFENKTGLITNENYNTDFPVGQYGKDDYELVILVNRTEIPKTDWLDTVTINSIQLNALVDYVENYTENKTFVTASYCIPEPWYVPFEKALEKNSNDVFKANEITTDYSKTCFPLDSIVAEKNDLPRAYSWDLSTATDAFDKSNVLFTFAIYAWPLVENQKFDSPDYQGGLVQFYSYSAIKSGDIGINTVPSFTITYTTEPTFFGYVRDIIYKQPADLLAVLAIIIPVIVWFYRNKIRKSKGS